MATTKTLTPTNQTISIPELSDSPDMSVPADAISKEADAINTLNSNIAKVLDSTTISGSTLAEVQTSLVTLISGMSDLSVRQIKFTLASATGQIEAATYYGKVTRHNSTIAIVEIQSTAANGDNSCIGTWRNSAWTWNRLALNSKIDPFSANAITDCNTAIKTGRYKTINSTANTPFTGHFVLDVIEYNSTEISQVARLSYSTRVFVRGSADGGSTWTNWQELALSSEVELLKPINFGDVSKSLTQNLTSYWTTSVPNDKFPRLCIVTAQGGSWFGFINRYSNNYGAGMFTRYDGYSGAVFLNNGTVTIKTLAYQT